MRKFKLIKKLPFEGSPDIGYISIEKLGENGAHYWNHNWFHPENYPEFWEEVTEKNWEVVHCDYSKGVWEIKKIRRKSDGEIFTIGDKVSITSNFLLEKLEANSDDIFEIKRFEPQFGIIRGAVYLEHSTNFGIVDIGSIAHAEEKSILITEDGKEILEGDTVYVTNIQANFLSNHSVTKDSIFKNSAFKYFAKKENMDRYIEENKPMYSRKEVRDFGGYILRNLKGVMPMKLLFELWLREKGN